jgi:DNA polymerase III delta prime subunit
MTDNLTLLEKYQPGALRDVYGHNTIRQILMSMVEQKNIPHLMFTGSPGNGKSTTASMLRQNVVSTSSEGKSRNLLNINR